VSAVLRNYVASPAICACGKRVILIRHDSGKWAPPQEPPSRECDKWREHLCRVRRKTSKVVVAPACGLHILRPNLDDRWAAYDEKTRARVPEGKLDHDCRRALHELRKGGLASGALFG
jgi:hypothetical protein